MADFPAPPAGVTVDPIPPPPPGVKLDPVESTSQQATSEGNPLESNPFFQRSHAAMEGLRQGKPQDFLGNLGGAAVELVKPELETIGMIEGGRGLLGAGKAALAGKLKPAFGVATALGTGYTVDRAAQALGMPAWISEILASGAGIAAGGRVGMSPEMMETLKGSGVKGFLNKWLNGTTENEAFKFYEETHGVAPKTGAEKLTARAEAAAFKKKVAESLKTPTPAKEEPRPGSGATVKKFGGSTNPLEDLGGTRGPQRVGKAVPEEPVESTAPTEDLFVETRGKLGKQLGKYTPAGEAQAGMGGKSPRYGKIIGRVEAREAEAEEKADELIEKTTKQPLKPKKGEKGEESGVTPMGKLKIRADIFSNVDQLATKAGANKVEFKKSFRDLVEKKYGKGLSEMNEEELMQVANSVQDLLKK